MSIFRQFTMAFVAGALCCCPCWGQCTPQWSHEFGWSGVNPEGDIQCFAVYDDGTGPHLYAGGSFQLIDGSVATGIATFVNDHWEPVGDGRGHLWDAANQFSAGRVFDMTVWDPDGPGPRRPILVTVGDIYSMGPTPENRVPARTVATWDGTTWGTLGSGIPTGDFEWWGTGWPSGNAVAVYNGELYVAGAVSLSGFTPSESGLVKWNGSAWVAVGHAKFKYGWPTSLAVYNDGSGDKLYVGGHFGQIWIWDPITHQHTPIPNTNYLVTWNGSSFQGQASLFPLQNPQEGVNNLRVLDIDGAGPQAPSLFVGEGASATAGNRTWRLTGNSAMLVPGLDGDPPAVYDDGSGPALFAFGQPPGYSLMKWTGVGSATPVSSFRITSPDGYWPCCQPRGGYTKASIVYDFGHGPVLVLGGYLSGLSQSVAPWARELSTYGVLTWDGTRYGSPSSRNAPVVFHADNTITEALGSITGGAVFDEDGPGPLPPAIYVTGQFNAISGKPAMGFARWSGSEWTPAGANLASPYDEPPFVSQPTVVGSTLNAISRDPGLGTTQGVFQYVSGTWTQLGPTFTTKALGAFDGGDGEHLYAAGQFASIGAAATNNIAKWNGSAWAPVGSGLGLQFSPTPSLATGNLLVSHNDGSGTKLYVFGTFDHVDGAPIVNIARWSGSAWSAVGAMPEVGTASFSTAVSINEGPAAGLYVTRTPDSAGHTLFVWRAGAWSPVAPPSGAASFVIIGTDGGSSGVLYAASTTDSMIFSYFTYDGTSWSSLNVPDTFGVATSMTAVSTPSGWSLYFFGPVYGVEAIADSFLVNIKSVSSLGVARLDCVSTPPSCSADFNHDGELNPDDLGDYITCYFTDPPCTGADYNGDNDVNPDDLGDFITAYFHGC